jgi:hypothetical protein
MTGAMPGVYKKVSPAYLQPCLDEYMWRRNAKRSDRALFAQLLERAAAQPEGLDR